MGNVDLGECGSRGMWKTGECGKQGNVNPGSRRMWIQGKVDPGEGSSRKRWIQGNEVQGNVDPGIYLGLWIGFLYQ